MGESFFDNLVWRCDVCGEERPDEKISVFKREHYKPVRMTENIKFCNDRPACFEGAKTFSHFGDTDA